MTSRSSACASSPEASWPSAVMIASTRRCARDRSLTTSARSSAGRSWMRSVSRSARIAVNGVRNSCAAFAAKSWAACREFCGRLLRGGEPAEHPRHRLGQFLGLTDAAHLRHLLGALAEPPGVFGEPPQRPDRGPGQKPARRPRRSTPSPCPPRRRTVCAPGSTGCCRRGCRSKPARRLAVPPEWCAPGSRRRSPRRSPCPGCSCGSWSPRWKTTWPVDSIRPVVRTPGGVGQLVGIHAGLDDGVQPPIQLCGIVIGENQRRQDREHRDDGGGRGRGGQGDPGAQRGGANQA